MRGCRLLFLAVALCAASAASAQTVVTVSPSNMGGWVTSAVYGASAYFTNVVPSPLDNPNPAGLQWPGAFFVQTNHAEPPNHPGQGWVGNLDYNDVACSTIQSMYYDTYTEPFGWGYWDNSAHWVRQPIRMWMLVAKEGVGGPNRRLMVFCPWGLLTSGENQSRYGFWERQNCMVDCPPVTPGTPGPGNKAYPGWYDIWTGEYGDWDYFFHPTTGIWKDAAICAPKEIGAGWTSDPTINGLDQMWCTPTGAGLNLWVGARSDTTPNIFGAAGYDWWHDSMVFAGFVDNLSITIGGQETVYDFQGDQEVPGQYCVAAGNAIDDLVTIRGKRFNYYTVHGVVINDTSTPPYVFPLNQDDFWIMDASGTRIKVIAGQHGVQEGWYVSVQGMMEPYTTRVATGQYGEFGPISHSFQTIRTSFERITHQQ